MLQSHNELCCEIHLRDCRLNNSPRIVVGAFSGSLGDSLPKGAKFCWNDKKQMRWDEVEKIVVLHEFKGHRQIHMPKSIWRVYTYE